MKKKLSLAKELISAELDQTLLEGGSLNSIACYTQIFPTCVTCTCDFYFLCAVDTE